MKIIEGTVAWHRRGGKKKHPHQELIQIDTTNILFICGGAFEGLDKIIETLLDRKSIGFNAEIASKHEYDVDVLLHEALPRILEIRLILKLVGRLSQGYGIAEYAGSGSACADPDRAEECDRKTVPETCWNWTAYVLFLIGRADRDLRRLRQTGDWSARVKGSRAIPRRRRCSAYRRMIRSKNAGSRKTS